MGSQPTIEDVARLASVGVGTASRALNNKPEISAATRQRVLEAATVLGFRPNVAAQSLRNHRTWSIGVIVPYFTQPFFVDILRGIGRTLSDSPYSMIVYSVERAEERHRYLGEMRLAGRVDGVIVVSLVPTSEEVARFTASKLPLILVDAYADGIVSISVDHQDAVYHIVSHLFRLGHTRIAFIDRPDDPSKATHYTTRHKGYTLAMREHNLMLPPEYQTISEYRRVGGFQAALTLLDLPEPPTAIVAASDLQAIGAIEAAKTRGLSVPADLAIVGYNDAELATFAGLTTMRLPTQDMGRQAVNRLLSMLDGHSDAMEHIIVSGELVIRQSSGGSLKHPTGE